MVLRMTKCVQSTILHASKLTRKKERANREVIETTIERYHPKKRKLNAATSLPAPAPVQEPYVQPHVLKFIEKIEREKKVAQQKALDYHRESTERRKELVSLTQAVATELEGKDEQIAQLQESLLEERKVSGQQCQELITLKNAYEKKDREARENKTALVEGLKKNLSDAEEELCVKDLSISKLTKLLARKNSMISSLEMIIDEKEERLDGYRRELAGCQQEVEDKVIENKKLSKLQEKAKNEGNERFRKEISRHQSEVVELQRGLSEKEEELKKKEREKAGLLIWLTKTEEETNKDRDVDRKL